MAKFPQEIIDDTHVHYVDKGNVVHSEKHEDLEEIRESNLNKPK
jgi:hypothetical protein